MFNSDLSTLDSSQMQISWQYQLPEDEYEDFGFHDLKEFLDGCAFHKLCINARIRCLAC